MSQPRVSVLIAVHETQLAWMEEALRSLLAQNYPRDLIECIVVDDGSTPAFSLALCDLLASLPDLPSQRFVRHATNRGQAAARNTAARAATGSHLFILDSDDVLRADAIRSCVEAIGDHPLVFTDKALFERRSDEPFLVRRKSGLFELHRRFSGKLQDPLLHMNFVCLGQMIRRDAFFAVDGYDERLRWAEDYDLVLRLGAKHGPGCFAHRAEPVYAYRCHTRGASTAERAHGQIERILLRACRQRGLAVDKVDPCSCTLQPYRNTFYHLRFGGRGVALPWVEHGRSCAARRTSGSAPITACRLVGEGLPA